jgi:hypothetical protein
LIFADNGFVIEAAGFRARFQAIRMLKNEANFGGGAWFSGAAIGFELREIRPHSKHPVISDRSAVGATFRNGAGKQERGG